MGSDTKKEKQPSWIESIGCQFELRGRYVHMPMWAYTLIIGGIGIFNAERLVWRIIWGMVVLSGLPSMVQRTRREHGARLPRHGWWSPFQNSMIVIIGIILMIMGAFEGWNNTTFAFGAVLTAVFSWIFIFSVVLSCNEKRDMKREL